MIDLRAWVILPKSRRGATLVIMVVLKYSATGGWNPSREPEKYCSNLRKEASGYTTGADPPSTFTAVPVT